MMTAEFSAKAVLNGRNLSGDKRLAEAYSVVAWRDGRLVEPVVARFWVTGMTTHATIWVHAPAAERSGYGRSTGYGYHRASDALAAALRSAGIGLSESIEARGDGAMVEALEAIARALDFQTIKVVHHA